MTAPLPPLPKPCGNIVWWTNESKRRHAENSAAFSKNVMRAYAKLAVRDALERARAAVRGAKENAFPQSADEAIRAMVEEYR